MRTLLTIITGLILLNCYSQDSITINIDLPYLIFDNEILIEMPQNKELQEKFFEIAEENGKQIDDNSGYTRRALPSDLMIKYSSIDTNQNVMVFDFKCQLVDNAEFNHFEFFESEIESGYMVNYKIITKDIDNSDQFFIVSANANSIISKSCNIQINDKNDLKEKIKESEIIKNMDLNSFYFYCDKTVKMIMDDEIFSYTVFSFEIDNNNDERLIDSYIYNTTNENYELICYQREQWGITDFLITPVMTDNKPIILMEIGYPDGDFISSILGNFKNDKFVITSGQIKIGK